MFNMHDLALSHQTFNICLVIGYFTYHAGKCILQLLLENQENIKEKP